jgi:hypothetical protein
LRLSSQQQDMQHAERDLYTSIATSHEMTIGDGHGEVAMEASMPALIKAIETRHRVCFTYNNKRRVVEPQCYGLGHTGTELLRAHQLTGGSQKEPLFDVSKLVNLQTLEERFDRPGPHYKQGDSAMSFIFAQL